MADAWFWGGFAELEGSNPCRLGWSRARLSRCFCSFIFGLYLGGVEAAHWPRGGLAVSQRSRETSAGTRWNMLRTVRAEVSQRSCLAEARLQA